MDASHVQGIHRMSVMSFVGKGRYVSVFVLLLFENIHSHIIDCGVVKYNDTTIWAGLDVYAAVFAEIVVAAAEIVAYGLNSDVELVGDAEAAMRCIEPSGRLSLSLRKSLKLMVLVMMVSVSLGDYYIVIDT